MAEIRVIQCDRCYKRQDLGSHIGWMEVKIVLTDFAAGASDSTLQFCKDCKEVVQKQ